MSGKDRTISLSAIVFFLSFSVGLVALCKIGLQEIEQELLFYSKHNQIMCVCMCRHGRCLGILKKVLE